ncbi:Tetratricopeptide repeat domain containing protein [Klebsormidium nitens]|uniref:Tetratricopeptide repeat domain containing protein n=1 Tax=Klebsormidium nitens TaxID=105231 RepID=A0A1Y1IQ05_KLENI|nr:Tetratricopeptide repeat domain containing protein [Klebsormidium nitens]|eukprot:GAQ90836.1 Tetratricopeptide repeat domain containing protein [Klebsormidium nitens]
MIKFAAEQMQRMSPEEIARIQQLAASMDPSVMASAARNMQSLRPEDMRMASEQLKQFSPEQLKEMGAGMENSDDLLRNAAILEEHTGARRQYDLKVAQKLKAEGNQLVSSGKHGEASQKYLKAKSNLEGHESVEARTLKTSCSLNLLICYLRTGQNEEAVREGSEVLRTDPSNLKALYRRGQAHRALGKLQLALTDLKKASQIDPDDETVRNAAQEVKEALAKQRSESSEPGIHSEVEYRVPSCRAYQKSGYNLKCANGCRNFRSSS